MQEINQEQKEYLRRQDLGAAASAALNFLEDWLEAYQEWTISNLKTCPVKEMAQYRNLLLASEAFKEYLFSVINDGKMAEKDFSDLEERMNLEARRGYYVE